MSIELGAGFAIIGIIFGWGASWATQGANLKALKESLDRFLVTNADEHKTLLAKMDAIGRLEVRVAVLETKVFGKPHQGEPISEA